MTIEKYDGIYDESGIVVGEAPPIKHNRIGEDRPETEPSDIELPSILDDDVLTESGLLPCDCKGPIFADEALNAICGVCGAGAFPKHDPIRYRVEEHTNTIDRNDFVFRYMAAKESCPALSA